MEMERLINSSGPTKGEIILPDSTEKPKSITYILCVGSRDEHTCSWCCRIGCMSALKQLYLLREKLPDVELNLCYMDIRSYGKKYEEFYRTVRGIKTNVFRGRPSEVRKDGNDIVVDVFDTMTGKLFEVKSDMVVLVPALTARHDAEDLARILRISQSPDGFYLEAHPKLRPMDTATGGIFLSGCCQGPKDIQDTVAQASGAASRVVSILAQETLEVEPLIAVVDEDLCSGCGNCVSICPYQAIELIKLEGGKSQAKVNEALCMGCGACAATCPSSAMQQKGFKDIQMIPVIDEMI
jgi:heterodisulfide reductase subunit A